MRNLILAGLSLTALTAAMPAAAQSVIQDGRWVKHEDRKPEQKPEQPQPEAPQQVTVSETPPPPPAPLAAPAQTAEKAPAPAPSPPTERYHRPVRGMALPARWLAPDNRVEDYAALNLAPPPEGSRWVRYYDDAVLVDRYGRVDRPVAEVDWDHPLPAEAAPVAVAEAAPPPPPPIATTPVPPSSAMTQGLPGSVAAADAAPPAPPVRMAETRREAAGTPRGADAGAVAGAAIDRPGADDRGPPPQYGTSYPPPKLAANAPPPRQRRWEPPVAPERAPGYDEPPVAPDYAPEYDEPPVAPETEGPGPDDYPFPPPPAPQVTCSGGCQSVVTTYAGSGYVANGYYYPPAMTTTITVNPQSRSRSTTEEWHSTDGTVTRRRVRRR